MHWLGRLLLPTGLALGSTMCGGGTTIPVMPGPPAGLEMLTQPSTSITNGVSFPRQPVVQLVDQQNIPVSQSGVQVTVALASGPAATLNGTLTLVTDNQGRAAFTGLSISGPNGAYTLSFDATGLTPAVSSFLVLGILPQGMLPLIDLGMGLYQSSFQGGLYPNGSNLMPSAQDSVGATRARAIRPLDTSGNPSASGKIVLLSVGISNATQEWCNQLPNNTPCDPWTFTGQALADPQVNKTTLVIANGAKGSQPSPFWLQPTDFNWDRIRDSVLAPKGLTEAQVQVIWLKLVNSHPTLSLPSAQADAYSNETEYGQILRAIRVRYPHIQIVFMSSRIYGGYAKNTVGPEPYAYESGFSVKWIIQAQIDQMANNGVIVDPRAGDLNYDTVAPWIAWGPYMWADGTTPRSDGLVWVLSDFDPVDGTHPSQQGETKVGAILLGFFKTDPHASCWFRAGQVCP